MNALYQMACSFSTFHRMELWDKKIVAQQFDCSDYWRRTLSIGFMSFQTAQSLITQGFCTPDMFQGLFTRKVAGQVDVRRFPNLRILYVHPSVHVLCHPEQKFTRNSSHCFCKRQVDKGPRKGRVES